MPTSISGVPTDPHSSCGSTQRYNAYNGFVYSVLKETKPTLPALSHRAEMSRDLHCSRSQDTPELIAAHLKPTPYFSPQTLRIFSTDIYSLTSTFIFLSFPGAKPPPTSTPGKSGQNFRPKKTKTSCHLKILLHHCSLLFPSHRASPAPGTNPAASLAPFTSRRAEHRPSAQSPQAESSAHRRPPFSSFPRLHIA